MRSRFLLLTAIGATLCLQGTAATAAFLCNTVSHPVKVTASALAFGNYSAGAGSPTNSNGSVKVSCSTAGYILPSLTVALSAGGAGQFNPRKMTSGSAKLNYNMYTSSAYTTIWGDGTGGSVTQSYSQSQNLNSYTFTNYGQVPQTQFVTAGSYTDTITVTVTF